MMIVAKQGRRLSVTRPIRTPNYTGVILREGPSYLNGETIGASDRNIVDFLIWKF